MSSDFWEAALLAASVPHNRCPATDAIEILDKHPELRLALEDTWTDDVGRVYREVPHDRLSRWSAPVARSFRAFMRIARDPDKAIRLMDLLQAIDADTAVVRKVVAVCRRRGSVDSALEYFEHLVAELGLLTYEPDREVELLTVQEPSCRTRYSCDGVDVGTWYVQESDEPDTERHAVSPSYRPELLWSPEGDAAGEQSWIRSQPRAWRGLYYRALRMKIADLPRVKSSLLEPPAKSWSHDQRQVLWDAYRVRRNWLRSMHNNQVQPALGVTARKLVRRVQRIGSKADAGRVGKGLYDAMKGELRLPGPVTEREWSIVFSIYRQRKAEILGIPA